MKKLCSLLGCLIALTFGANTALANDCPVNKFPPPPHAKMKPYMKHKVNIAKELNLTDDQKAMLKENQKISREKLIPIKDKQDLNRLKFEEVKKSDMTAEEKHAKFKELKAEARDLRRQANVIREDDRKYFESILTDKQKEKFEKIKAKQKKEIKKRSKFEKRF